MTVRVSKPAFNLRDKISELDKPTGVHGNDILKSNSLEETCAIVGSGRRNFVINGNFDIWQRGLTFSSFNSTKYTADRWLQYAAGSSTITASRQNFTSGQTEVPGNPRYFYRMDNTPDADTSWLELMHRVEHVRRFSNRPVTLSFWMRANKPQYGEDEIRLTQNFGTSGSTAVTTLGPRFDIHTYWKKYEFTFDLPSVVGKTINPNNHLQIHWLRVSTAVAADTYYDIAQVQLEYGRGATPFEERSYGEEFNLCERYYQLYGGLGNATGDYYTTGIGLEEHTPGFHAMPGWAWADSAASTRIMLRQRMRSTPDINIIGTIQGSSQSASDTIGSGTYGVYGGGSNAWQTPGSWAVGDVNDHSFRVTASSYSTFGTGKAVGFYIYRGAGFTVNAEFSDAYQP
tara:strand:+ start:1177 stop:2376 length:1200 start_codon:yes stop_codon:yes gene_type:complete